MVVYAPVAPTYRTPPRRVVVAGTPLIKVFSARVTRGWDQELATAEVLIPYPLPSHVRHRSQIQIYMGGSVATNYLRFSGYITSINLTIWPGRILLGCEDMLALAKYYRPESSVSLEGLTDQAAVETILTTVGLPFVTGLIGGTGKVIGEDDEENPALLWEPTTSALAKIQEIDQISVYDTDDGFQGIYRTYADPGGIIRRIPLHPLPAATPAHTFTEGTDIEQGSVNIEAVEPSRVATANGSSGLSVTLTGSNPWATLSNPAFGLYPLIEETTSAVKHNLTDMASYLLQQAIANMLRIDLTLRRDDLIGAYETERVIAPHGMVDILALVQSITTETNEAGGFLQQLSLISYRELNIAPGIGADDPFTGEPIDPGAPPTLPEPVDELLVSFNIIGIDKEIAELPDNPTSTGQAYYIVTAEDASTSPVGTIETQTWAADGPGVRITEGSGPTFTTSFTDLAGAEITLTVTDSAGNTGSLTLPVDTGSTPVRSRTLFACSEIEMYANDGEQWRKRAPIGGGSVQCVANGPMWGAGRWIAVSEDYLATAPNETAVFSSEDVSTIWISESNSLFAAAGGADGGVAVTRDRGATWEPRTAPGSAVNQIIVSIHDTSEIHVATPAGWRKSQDEGRSWQTVRSGNFTYLELSHSRNIVVTSTGALQKAEDGTAFTGITGTVVAATAHIRSDEFAALTSDGNTWVSESSGSYAMVAGAPIPDGTPAPAGTYRDGLQIGLVYYAANDGGLWKTLDFFATENGYLRILRDGMITP